MDNDYIVNLKNSKDYQKAKDIITSDFDFEDLQETLINISSSELKNEIVKDKVTNVTMNDNDNISRFYKIAFYEVSKAWQEECGIKHVKFFPNHMLADFIAKLMGNTLIFLYIFNFPPTRKFIIYIITTLRLRGKIALTYLNIVISML